MVKLADEEIVKALKLCRSGYFHCEECPLWPHYRGVHCRFDLTNIYAVELIERLMAEVDGLERENTALRNDNNIKAANIEYLSKIERATEVFEKLEERLFVHSFKTKSEDYTQGQVDCMDFVDSKIEELKKELVGDSDG